jgi:hypothetical protein
MPDPARQVIDEGRGSGRLPLPFCVYLAHEIKLTYM